MSEVWFYHLERSSAFEVLPELLEKVRQKKWRTFIHGSDLETLNRLDSHLWTYRPDRFLAHGLQSLDPALDAPQPIVLGQAPEKAGDFEIYISLSPIEPPSLKAYQRSLVLFEGQDEAHLRWARALWSRLKTEFDLAYWQQSPEGRWERKT